MLQRRRFFGLGAAAMAGLCMTRAFAKEYRFALKITQITIPVGLPKPLKALHFSDSHICLADNRDTPQLIALAEKRAEHFHYVGTLKAIPMSIAYAREHKELILYTGDFEDFVTAANLDYIKKAFAGEDCIASVGNHEYTQHVYTKDESGFHEKAIALIKGVWPNDVLFSSRVVGGINFVAFDNSYSCTTLEQLSLLKKEIAKGLPVVLLCHVPYYSEELYLNAIQCRVKDEQDPCIMGVPKARWQHPKEGEPQMRAYIANPATQAFIDYFEQQPLIKAVLCGHLHREWSGKLPGIGIPEYVVGLGAAGYVHEITFE